MCSQAQCTEVLACSLWGRQVTRDATGGITQWAVALVNTGSKSHRITLDFAKLGWTLSTKAAVVDVWTNTSLPDAVGAWEADVPSHGTVVAFLRLIR